MTEELLETLLHRARDLMDDDDLDGLIGDLSSEGVDTIHERTKVGVGGGGRCLYIGGICINC